MPNIEYSLYFDNNPATTAQKEKIDEITIQQEVDMAWEARLKIPITVDGQGNWTGDDENFMRAFARLRVEVKIGDQPSVPLFDGPVTGFESTMSSEPGQSSMTVIALDDTYYLNRLEQVVAYENKADHEVATDIYNEFGNIITSTVIESTPATGSAFPPNVMQRGTAMDILRYLSKRQGKHAYVLPGERPGESIGCFSAYPTATDGLTPLLLLGEERNIDSLQVNYCACKPANATASILRISDKSVVSETVQAGDAETMGDEPGEVDDAGTATRFLPPHQGETVDLAQAVTAVVTKAGYAYDVSAELLEETYPEVVSPYRVITVRAGNTPISGDYLIVKTTHNITRGGYAQSVELKRNARSTRFGSGQAGAAGGIF